MVEGGSINFNPDSLKDVVHGEELSYDDYIEAQIRSVGKTHSGFQWCYYNLPLEFKGKVQKVQKKHICFEAIYICGMFPDGECPEYKEQHVWMDSKGFEDLAPGDCVAFFAEPYSYLKTGNGKQIDYGLKNPSGITRIQEYELPSDKQIIAQEMSFAFRDSLDYLD